MLIRRLVLGLVLILLLAIAGCGSSSTDSSTSPAAAAEELPTGTVAVVSHVSPSKGTISLADLHHGILIQAAQGKLPTAPQPGDPKYKKTEEAALGEILDQIWIEGEAEELGIVVTDNEISKELEHIKKQNFKTEAEYQEFLTSSKFTEENVNERVKLQLLSTQIQESISSESGNKTEEQKQFATFVTAYQRQWRARTICAPTFVSERCANGPQPEESKSKSGTGVQAPTGP